MKDSVLIAGSPLNGWPLWKERLKVNVTRDDRDVQASRNNTRNRSNKHQTSVHFGGLSGQRILPAFTLILITHPHKLHLPSTKCSHALQMARRSACCSLEANVGFWTKLLAVLARFPSISNVPGNSFLQHSSSFSDMTRLVKRVGREDYSVPPMRGQALENFILSYDSRLMSQHDAYLRSRGHKPGTTPQNLR